MVRGDDYDAWSNATVPQQADKLGAALKTAHIVAGKKHVVPFLGKCLEGSCSTLTSVKIEGESDREEREYEAEEGTSPLVFEHVKTLTVTSEPWLEHIGRRLWVFPNLTQLHVGTISATNTAFTAMCEIVKAAPALTSLDADHINFTSSKHWRTFLCCIARCPMLTTITGLTISAHPGAGGMKAGVAEEGVLGHCPYLTTTSGIAMDVAATVEDTIDLCGLKQALDANWTKDDMKGKAKKLGLVYEPTIGVAYGASEAAFISWAQGVCEVDWRSNSLAIDCSKTPTDTTQMTTAVPHNVGKVVKDIAHSVKQVYVSCGGTAVGECWQDILTFPACDELHISGKGASGDGVANSVPDWMVHKGENGNNRCLPAVSSLHVRFDKLTAEWSPGGGKLSQLMGGLHSVQCVSLTSDRLTAACDCLSFLSADKRPLENVLLSLPSDVQGLPDPISSPTDRWQFPAIAHLTVTAGVGKACVQSGLHAVPVIGASCVDFEGVVFVNEFSDAVLGMKAFALDCFTQVQEVYGLTHMECRKSGPHAVLKMKLFRKTEGQN